MGAGLPSTESAILRRHVTSVAEKGRKGLKAGLHWNTTIKEESIQ